MNKTLRHSIMLLSFVVCILLTQFVVATDTSNLTDYVPFTITYSDSLSVSASTKDMYIAMYVFEQLKSEALIPDQTLSTKLFSNIDAKQLDNQVTLVLYKGSAIVVVGEHSPSSHMLFAQKLYTILQNKNISVKPILSSDITSSDLHMLFTNTTCAGVVSQLCIITNGVGSQSRTCNSGTWSDWGTCTATTCNIGYIFSNGACIITTTYTPFIIGIGDTAPSSDTVIALDVIQQLKSKGLVNTSGNTAISFAKLFSELNAKQLDNQVTLVLYKGSAIVVVGEHSPPSHILFAQSIYSILQAKGISVKPILSSDITSSDLNTLFTDNSGCTDSDGGKNYYVKGTVIDGANSPSLKIDSCLNKIEDSPGHLVGNGEPIYSSAVLGENYCESNDVMTQMYICPNGCVDGVCVQDTNIKTTLANYPRPFISVDKVSNAVFIVGRNAAVDDVIGITDMIASLQRYASDNPFPVGLVKFDDQIDDNKLYNQNVVIVGGMCANTATEKIYGMPSDCTSQDTPGIGKIKIIPNKGTNNYVLLVHGYSAQDTTMATRVLANWDDYADVLNGATQVCVDGTLDNIHAYKC